MPEGKVWRRGHWVSKPTPKPKGGKWIGWAVAAVLVYAGLHSCFGGSSASGTSHTPKPSASASAHR
jgi:hypothetical protein